MPNHLKLAFETIVCQPKEHDGGLKHMTSFVLPKTWASFLAAGLWQLVTLGESFSFASFIFLLKKSEMGMERWLNIEEHLLQRTCSVSTFQLQWIAHMSVTLVRGSDALAGLCGHLNVCGAHTDKQTCTVHI